MDQATLVADSRDTLEECSFGRDEDRLAGPPTLEDVYRATTNREGDPVYVPLVEVDLETDDVAGEPDRASAYRIAAEIVRGFHTHFRDVHVRQYDIVFAYGDTSFWNWDVQKRRIAVRPQQADRLTREPDFGPSELRERLEELDDGDDEIPPVAWGETLSEWEYYHDDGGDWAWLGFAGLS